MITIPYHFENNSIVRSEYLIVDQFPIHVSRDYPKLPVSPIPDDQQYSEG
jgi:hypothetical protein